MSSRNQALSRLKLNSRRSRNRRLRLEHLEARAMLAGEVNVQGNALSITDGDISPRAADFTDFGSTSVLDGEVTRTFTIQNLHPTETLSITSLVITENAVVPFVGTILPGAADF